MKALFKYVRQGKLDEVKRILLKNPELINCTATAPPKKDEGQSPLQVAIKSDNAEVADLLLDQGADVNFMEAHVYYDEALRAPVLYDAIGQVFLGWGMATNLWFERNEKYLRLVSRLLELGADPNKINSDGSSSWYWVLKEYAYFISAPKEGSYNYEIKMEKNKRYLELASRLLEKLAAYGADVFFIPSYFFEYDLEKDYWSDRRQVIYNLICNRDITYGFAGHYEREEFEKDAYYKWNLIEPVLRPYYKKDNPYYGGEAVEEKKEFFREMEQFINQKATGSARPLE